MALPSIKFQPVSKSKGVLDFDTIPSRKLDWSYLCDIGHRFQGLALLSYLASMPYVGILAWHFFAKKKSWALMEV